jgi:serpin B
VPRTTVDPALAEDAAAAINAFGFDVYAALRTGDANLVFSPASIQLAMAMARAGARSETADQMDRVMHDLGSDRLADALNALDQALADRNGTFPDGEGTQHDLILRIANAPFAQRDFPFEEAYLTALAERFGAGVRLVDYATDPEAARQVINGWVDEQTEERIPELLPQGVINELTRLTLVNAIYLKAPWLLPFAEQATEVGTFTRPDGTTVEVPLMTSETRLGYADGRDWQAVELPYLGETLAMTLILPDDLHGFEDELDADAFEAIVGSLASTNVRVTMPRFDIETKAGLADILDGLGMPLAFDPDRADFSGMTSAAQLYITAVVHQANITVDEAGTEAAAATAVVIGATSAPPTPVEVRFDRPFLFAVRDLGTGAILFCGRVTDPSAGA